MGYLLSLQTSGVLPEIPLAFLPLPDVHFSGKLSLTPGSPHSSGAESQRCSSSDPTCVPGFAASAALRRSGAAGFAAHGSRSDFGSDSHSGSAAFGLYDLCDPLTASESVYPDPSAGTMAASLTQISGACAGGFPRPRRAPGCPGRA